MARKPTTIPFIIGASATNKTDLLLRRTKAALASGERVFIFDINNEYAEVLKKHHDNELAKNEWFINQIPPAER